MLLKSFAILAFIIAAILLFAATRPDVFHIQRSLTVQASPEKVFPLINDLHQWPLWAPQDKEDPSMKRTYSGAASGTGAISDWSGSGNTGRGRMTITESVPSKQITIQVDWVRPFTARNMNQFTLEAQGASTRISWSMQGPNLYFMKVMSVFTNMDRVMGQHFETGLANLKLVAETMR